MGPWPIGKKIPTFGVPSYLIINSVPIQLQVFFLQKLQKSTIYYFIFSMQLQILLLLKHNSICAMVSIGFEKVLLEQISYKSNQVTYDATLTI